MRLVFYLKYGDHMKTYYQVLGVAETATEAEIKKVFRRLARENHPDTHPGDAVAEARFKEVAEAYETLGDPLKRKQYDLVRTKGQQSRSRARPTPKNPFDFTMDFDDIFSNMPRSEKPDKQTVSAKQNKENPLNVDDVFSKFMGFKPKGG